MRFIKGISAVVQRQRNPLSVSSSATSSNHTTCLTSAQATTIGVIASQLHHNLRTVVYPYSHTDLTSFSENQSECEHSSTSTSNSDVCNAAHRHSVNLVPRKECNIDNLGVSLVNNKTQHPKHIYRKGNNLILSLQSNCLFSTQKLLEPSDSEQISRHDSSQRRCLSTLGPATKMSETEAKTETKIKVPENSGATVNKTSIAERKVDIRRVMAAEDDWILTAGGHRIHAWSISGVESCIVAEVSGTRLAFDMGYATRPSIKCAHVFISHGHIDHVAALVKHAAHRSLFSLPPATYYIPPHLEEPLRAMANSMSQLHGGDEDFCDLKLKTVNTGETVEVTKSIKVLAFPTVHRVPSQGYIVYRTRKCLREEFVGRPGPEIGALVKDGVDVHEMVTAPEIAYTGDTTFEVFLSPPTEDLLRVRTLITESTYIDDEQDKLGRGGIQRARERGHSHIQEHINNEQLFKKVEQIVLVHFSDKYSVRYIRRRTEELLTEGLRKKVALGITMKQTLG